MNLHRPDLSSTPSPTLRDLTWEAHKKIENHPVMRQQLDGTIPTNLMCDWISIQHAVFKTIEDRVIFLNLELNRGQLAFSDWQKIKTSLPNAYRSIDTYLQHLMGVDEKKIWAHVYVNYLGNLYGGQLIRKKLKDKYPTSRYDFKNSAQCIAEIRSHLSLDLAEEANLAFQSLERIMDDIYQPYQ